MRRDQKGFTLMELMVVIVIVAILAAVAVPLYINYVKDAQRTEAKGAIGAIVSAQQVFYQQSALVGAPTYAASLTELEGTNTVDLTEPKSKWNFEITNGDETGFDVKATYIADNTLTVCYTFTRAPASGEPAGKFTDCAS